MISFSAIGKTRRGFVIDVHKIGLHHEYRWVEFHCDCLPALVADLSRDQCPLCPDRGESRDVE
jgi:hypothetical protein